MSRITKKELFAALADYPENAQIIFNDDDNLQVMDIAEIRFHDDDHAPVLCSEALSEQRIFIHLKKNWYE